MFFNYAIVIAVSALSLVKAIPAITLEDAGRLVGVASVNWINPGEHTEFKLGETAQIKFETFNMGRYLTHFDPKKVMKIHLINEKNETVKTIFDGNFNHVVRQKEWYGKLLPYLSVPAISALFVDSPLGMFSQNHWTGIANVPWNVTDVPAGDNYRLRLEINNGWFSIKYGFMFHDIKDSPVFKVKA